MKSPLPFGVSEFTTWPWSFERDVERYAANGIPAIEVCEFKLNRNDYAPQLKAIAAGGLTVSSVQSEVHSLFPDSLAPQPTAPDDRVAHIKKAIARIAPHVPERTPFVVITGAAPGGDTAAVYQKALGAFDDLATFAAERKMRLAYEPLNPVLFNTDTALWGLDQALELVRHVGHEAFGLCVDTWNVFQTPALHDVLGACGDRIFLVQVSDWHRPRSGADRISLGDGEIDNTAIMRTIRATGYRGPYVLEIFSGESLPDSIWRSDLDVTLRKNLDAFARTWQASER
ncbi:MAG TPA: sugar phosphate isomerase/epimerase family protein [Candidatus Baltobacteraceae bacterium]|nr:sugar phosphate isomerase/epimerase family protein [Candidatus Baltobacteraceae bacterium]